MSLRHYNLRFFKVRMVFVAIAAVLIIMQLVAISRMMASNQPPREITSDDYDSLTVNSEVSGKLREIIGEYEIPGSFTGDEISIHNYLAKTSQGKIIIFRTVLNSECDRQVKELSEGKREYVYYRGKVKTIPENYRQVLSLYIISSNLAYSQNLSDHVISGTEIDITLYKDNIDAKYIIFTIVGAVFMFVVLVWLLLKPLNNLVYNIMVQKGKIQPELNVKKEDLIIDNSAYVESNRDGYFYVGNENSDGSEKDDVTVNDSGKDMPQPSPMRVPPDDEFFYSGGANDSGSFYVNGSDDGSVSKRNNDRLNY